MIRTFELDDTEYVVASHYELYHREFQYDLSFRDFIADKVNGFIDRSDLKEKVWVLEIDNKRRGSISIMKVNGATAQLGLFLVDPQVRGGGYGQHLIETAIQFCREQGFENVILWTNRELQAARRLYEKNGFELQETKKQILSNKELVEEKWALKLKEIKMK